VTRETADRLERKRRSTRPCISIAHARSWAREHCPVVNQIVDLLEFAGVASGNVVNEAVGELDATQLSGWVTATPGYRRRQPGVTAAEVPRRGR